MIIQAFRLQPYIVPITLREPLDLLLNAWTIPWTHTIAPIPRESRRLVQALPDDFMGFFIGACDVAGDLLVNWWEACVFVLEGEKLDFSVALLTFHP